MGKLMGNKKNFALSLFILFMLFPINSAGGVAASLPSASGSSAPAATPYPAQMDQDIEVTISGQVLYIYQSWSGFKEGAKPTDRPIDVYGQIQNASVKFTFSPIGHTVAGTMTGAYSSPDSLTNVSFTGRVSGTMEPKYWSAGTWLWEINATASVDMTFKWGNKTGSTIIWTTKTLRISDEFRISALDRPDRTIIDFDIYWSDFGGINGGARYFSMYIPGEGFNATRFPVLLDFNYTISGPDAISPATPSAYFTVETTGVDKDMIANATWEFYYLNSYTQVYTLCSYTHPSAVGRIYMGDDSPVTVTGSTISSWLPLLQQYGVSQQGMKVLPMRVMMSFYADPGGIKEMVGWEEWYDSTFDFVLQEQPVLSGQIVGMGYPMKYAKLEFKASGGATFSGTTDAQGRFTVPADASKSGTFTLSIVFAYQRDGITYFTLHHRNTNPDPASDTTPPLALDLSVSDGAITAATFRYRADSSEAITVPEGKTVAGISLDDYLTDVNRLECFTGMYNHFTEALEFYKDYLGEDLSVRAPLKVYTFVGKDTAYDSVGSISYITINQEDSFQGSPTRPKNREYHEFSHYVMHTLYGSAFDYPSSDIGFVNHGGYTNPTTIDSYQEAFASFMATMIGIHYGNYWDTFGYETPDSLGIYGSLETNYRAWERDGKAEEMAIAGVLWDLYDGGRDRMNMEGAAAIAMFSEADFNRDLVINKTELLVLCLETSYKGEYSGEDAIFDSADFNAMVQSNGWSQDELNDRLMEHVGEEIIVMIPLLTNGMGKDEAIARILEIADKDSSGSLNSSELQAEAPEGKDPIQYASMILQLFDGNDNGALEANEIAALAGHVAMDNYQDHRLDAIMAKYGATYMPDEDSVEIDFLLLWDVLKAPHRDFKSVYDSLASEFPQLEKGINDIFIAHGIFADSNRGDGFYNLGEPYRDRNSDGLYGAGDYFVDMAQEGIWWSEGETIGQATNYNRTERRSLISLPGQVIRVNNSAPYYWMELTCIDPSMDQGLPLRFYKIQLFNSNGSIYFPMPPPGYISKVKIYPSNVTYGKSLVFASPEFEGSYSQAVQQGYFKQHDFQITGQIPSLPLPPGTGGSQPPTNQTQSRCFIATATYGSEAAPQVQFLREFRDNIAMQTFTGSSFMNGFLGWYYSWSPPVAYSIAPDGNAKALMRVVLQPILNILQVAAYTYSSLSFNSEFAIVMAGFVAAALIGLIYLTPIVTIAFLISKRLKSGLALPSARRALRLIAVPWIAVVALIAVAELVAVPTLMVFATAAFVVLTITMIISTTSLWLAGFYRRAHQQAHL